MNRRDPFEELERFLDRMTRQFETEFEGVDVARRLGGETPAVDVEDAGDEFVVTADLPGYATEDISVELHDDTLRLSADREGATETDRTDVGGRFVRRERTRQAVSRSVTLPETVDEDAVSATYNNGVLTVTLPKRTGEAGGHTIDIE